MQDFPKSEKEILKFWQEQKIFEKSLENTKGKRTFVFYDGPPFATGLPHYGHILGSVIKDVVPRYWTMKGYYVRRRWGWDCHGLPIENMVEKELGLSGKKDIEERIGVEKFNETCRSKVLMFTKEWKKMIDRIGRWVEFDNAYKTMDPTYMESVWWALKSLWDKGLVYESRKVLMYCPHCETPVSKAEVAMDNSYKDITEEAVTVKFKLKPAKIKINLPQNTYALAWTTTPWTLPGNVALALGKDIRYAVIKSEGDSINYLLAKDRITAVFKNIRYEILSEFSGSDLAGIGYEPLYEISAVKKSGKAAWYMALGDFVNTEEGTGIVHTAVIYGEDDYDLGTKLDLPMVPLLDSKGIFNREAPSFVTGKYFKDSEKDVKSDLANRGLIFARENHTHSYPFCWRCDTQLFYNAISAWFINIQKNKAKLIKFNQRINWFPKHLKNGRFLNILKTAPDWNISRNRYWATPLPFWKCECGNKICVGSVEELKSAAVNFNEVYGSEDINDMDLHKHKMDRVKLKCGECGKIMSRVPEVIDCWVESASMPFAELHFPFENKKLFKERFPGEYIAEYIAQTRTWFYYMHAISAMLFNSNGFNNVVTTGTILNEKGEKLSKSKKNYTDPWIIIDRYGVDALRFYLMSSVVMQADDLFFNEREVKEAYNKVINTLWNVVEFYKLFGKARLDFDSDKAIKFGNVLDVWILSRLSNTTKNITEQMDNYDTVKTCRLIREFIDDLSLWYVRRSRNRFKFGSDEEKRQSAAALYMVLDNFSKIIAPILPFTAEAIYREINNTEGDASIHSEAWPKYDKKLIVNTIEEKMKETRAVVNISLSERAAKNVNTRHPIKEIKIKSRKLEGAAEFLELIKDEVNAKEITFDGSMERDIELDTKMTPELIREGNSRDFIRAINAERKKEGLTLTDKVLVFHTASDADLDNDIIISESLAEKIEVKKEEDLRPEKKRKIKIQGNDYLFEIIKK